MDDMLRHAVRDEEGAELVDGGQISCDRAGSLVPGEEGPTKGCA